MKTQLALLLAFIFATSALAQTPAPDARLLRFDRNGDGLLAQKELPYPNMFKRLDTDGNGLLTRQEVSQFRLRRRQQTELLSPVASPQRQPPEDSWFVEAAQFNPSRARAGAVFDAFVSNPEVNAVPLESIAVPTLIVHAVDDPLASYDAAVRAAERIPGAVLVGLASGGHLALGQADRVRSEVAAFLDTSDRSRSGA